MGSPRHFTLASQDGFRSELPMRSLDDELLLDLTPVRVTEQKTWFY
jgi:hypothetical protein